MKTSELFDPEPIQWGLRGDPLLWREMAGSLSELDLPDTKEELFSILENAYLEATERDLSEGRSFKVERFKWRGMSSGMISPGFWNRVAIPLLLQRYEETK